MNAVHEMNAGQLYVDPDTREAMEKKSTHRHMDTTFAQDQQKEIKNII